MSCGCSSTFILSPRAHQHARARSARGDMPVNRQKVGPHRLGQVRQREAEQPRRTSAPAAAGGRWPPTAPLTRRFVVLKLFAPGRAVWDRTKSVRQIHPGRACVAARLRNDHGGDGISLSQVICLFDGLEKTRWPGHRREPSHGRFVSWHTMKRRWASRASGETPSVADKVAADAGSALPSDDFTARSAGYHHRNPLRVNQFRGRPVT